MTGLQIEIMKRKHGKKSTPEEKFSITKIANLLGTSYMSIKRKLEKNNFEVEESLAIFKTLIPVDNQTLPMYEYLFTNQKEN